MVTFVSETIIYLSFAICLLSTIPVLNVFQTFADIHVSVTIIASQYNDIVQKFLDLQGSSHSVIYGTIHVSVSNEPELVPEMMSAPVKLRAIRRKNYTATMGFALASRSITATKTTLIVRSIPAVT